jgi:hypothetical protein
MNNRGLLLFVALALFLVAAGPPNFAGEYADKKFLNGQGVFQLSLEQTGDNVSVFFSAGYNDGHGAAPEAEGRGKITAKGTAEFTFEDSFKNAGSGTINRSADGVIVAIKTTRVADPRCLAFYKQNIHLARVKK